MVVIRSKRLETIYDSLESLLEFFSSSECESMDNTTLQMAEHDLVCLEGKLKTHSSYRRRNGPSDKNS